MCFYISFAVGLFFSTSFSTIFSQVFGCGMRFLVLLIVFVDVLFAQHKCVMMGGNEICFDLSMDVTNCAVGVTISALGLPLMTKHIPLSAPRQCFSLLGNDACINVYNHQDITVCVSVTAFRATVEVGCIPASPAVMHCIENAPTSVKCFSLSFFLFLFFDSDFDSCSCFDQSSSWHTSPPSTGGICIPVQFFDDPLSLCGQLSVEGCDLALAVLINGTAIPLGKVPVLQVMHAAVNKQ
jgi:hypothetical protein